MKESWNFLRTLALVLALAGFVQGSVQSQSPSATGEVKAEAPAEASSQAATTQSTEQPQVTQASESATQNPPEQTSPSQAPTPSQVPQGTPQQPLPAQTSVPLRVMVGKSLLVNTSDRLKRVSVTDPAIADALVVTPNQVLIHGRAPGEVSLLLWDEQERSRSFDLRVDVDSTAAAEEMKRIFPDQDIKLSSSRSAIVLSGHVETKEAAERAGAVASAYSKNIINVLSFGPVGAQEVLLEVKFAEVDRTALLQLGLNIFSTGAANTIGNVTTQQFGGTTPITLTDTIGTRASPFPNVPVPTAGASVDAFTTTRTINDLLNVFLFRPDIHLGATIKALQQKNILQILAEPNLIAVNGKEASFLAGGEFPYPVIQPGGNGSNTITIQFKEFGVRLNFTPVITPAGNIRLHVRPEVSALDFANALTISGFVIPALSTRRAETDLELKDGQSFVIAGLMDNRVTDVGTKVPGLGNLPIIGYLFKSKNLLKSKSELMVLVTVRRVSPSDQPPALPKMPEKPLDVGKFDPKTPAGAQK
jgi:pilus assembly protein CpaC